MAYTEDITKEIHESKSLMCEMEELATNLENNRTQLQLKLGELQQQQQ